MKKIQGGLIYDGSGSAPFVGDLLLEGDKILEVAPRISCEDAQVIPAHGRAVTPGFIDTHRHCDLAALFDPEFGKLESAQGITTVVAGNCGLAPAPAVPELSDELYDFLEPCLGTAPGRPLFPKVSDYMERLREKKYPVNVGVLCATGAVTTAAKGFANLLFTPETMAKAEAYIADAMEAGALGLSCGIMYTPECYSRMEDFISMAKAAAPYGGYLTSHIRGEGNSLLPSVREVLAVGEQAGVPVNISHFKVTGKKNWGRGIQAAIELIEKARARGQDVTADAYPYTGGSTTALSLVPPTVLEASGGDLFSWLKTKAGADLLCREIEKEFDGWDNMVSSIGWDRILISSVIQEKDRIYAGKNMEEAAAMAGQEPGILLARLIAENQGKVGVILMSMSQEDVDTVLKLPYVSVISDALYGGGDMPHPRLYGAFPRIIREYVVERKLLTLEEAVRKMTSLPAKRAGLSRRGLLKAGYQADILLFDPKKVRDPASFQNPKQLAEGFDLVLVNGKPAGEREGVCLSRNGER